MLEIQQGAKRAETPALVGIQPVLAAPGHTLAQRASFGPSRGHTLLITSVELNDGPAAFSSFGTAWQWRTRPATDWAPEHKV